MSKDDTPSICPAIRQWEEAGVLLAQSLSNYLELSISLEKNSLSENTPSTYLATRIDHALNSLHTTLDNQISCARSTLAQARNRIMSPVYCFPEEVLSEIFMQATITPIDPIGYYQDLMEQSVIQMYRELHNILGVCSVWRNILLNRCKLWSIIPVVNTLSRSHTWKNAQATRIAKNSIGRAGKGKLYLAITKTWHSLFDSIRELAPRFHAVNIDAEKSTIFDAMNIFLLHHTPEPLALTHLSLRQRREYAYFEDLPRPADTLFTPQIPREQEAARNIARNLSVFRIAGVHINWDNMTFSHRLTELHLQNVLFGFASGLNGLFGALSSATELRDLRLISIRTFYDPTVESTSRRPEVPKVLLPNLQTFIIQDLYYNTLNFLLASLDPRCLDALTLILNGNCHSLYFFGHAERLQREWVDFTMLLGGIPLKTLMVCGRGVANAPWLSALQLRSMVRAVPTLEALYLRSLPLDEEYCEALERPSELHDSTFPRLVKLHINAAAIRDKSAFKTMLASHFESIRRVELGGEVYGGSDGSGPSMSLAHAKELVGWIEDNVPSFQILKPWSYPSPFDEPVWQLW